MIELLVAAAAGLGFTVAAAGLYMQARADEKMTYEAGATFGLVAAEVTRRKGETYDR